MPVFRNDYSFVTDWDALIRLSDAPGRFVCIEKPLISYRIHQGAATKANILNHNREKEEEEMYRKLWPGFVSEFLMRFYKLSYRAYD